jgi:large subunit ribosomal protein L22
MEAKASSKNIRMSVQKMRQVINRVRGMGVEQAVNAMKLTRRNAAKPIEKTIMSAVANAMESDKTVSRDQLYVKTIFADDGMKLKRIMPRAMGRAARFVKHSCHLTVVVSTK